MFEMNEIGAMVTLIHSLFILILSVIIVLVGDELFLYQNRELSIIDLSNTLIPLTQILHCQVSLIRCPITLDKSQVFLVTLNNCKKNQEESVNCLTYL